MPDAVANRILRMFAELAVDARPTPVTMIAADRVAWVPPRAANIFVTGKVSMPAGSTAPSVRDLVKRALLHRDEQLLRVGWLWLAGPGPDGPVVFPLVRIPVTASDGSVNLLSAGDYELSEQIADPRVRAGLEDPVEIGGGALDEQPLVVDAALLIRLPRLLDWARRAAAAAGFPEVLVEPFPTAPFDPAALVAPVVFVAAAVYLAEPAPPPTSTAATLRTWADDQLPDTAFHHLYGVAGAGTRPWQPAMSPLVLDPAQRDAVDAARRVPLSVVSGPPGTGKSQTVAAIALDAIANGASVLVAAPSDAAVGALIDLLERAPGPDPVVFGSAVRRDELAARLAAQGTDAVSSTEVRSRLDAAITAGTTHGARRSEIAALLDAELLSDRGPDEAMLRARSTTPGFFDGDADLGALEDLVAAGRGKRWWRRRRARRAVEQLRASSRTLDAGATLDDLARGVDAASRARRASIAEAAGGITVPEATWAALADAESAHRDAVGTWLAGWTRERGRTSPDQRAAIAGVAAALRSGRANRRRLLAEIPGADVAAALPLWVGSLRDIDDLLPRTAAMFDVVLIDEASQVDVLAAAPALLRARRAVVVGDPRQLRHVSFLADEAVAAAQAAHVPDAPPQLASRLDVRRSSLFDAAAAVTDAAVLDQHYRSAPHLIEFSARTFYDGRLTIATRHPRNDAADYIDVVRVPGERDDGVNRAEVDAVLALIREASGRGVRSLGVLTPFRAQADAIEAAVLDATTLDELTALDLRVGTVHGFQGCERDEIVVSLALDDESAAGSTRFVHDPNLFNVMVTRARRRMTIVTSLGDGASGLTAALLAHAEAPPRRPGGGDAVGWVAVVANEARARGLTVTTAYPVGRGVVDVCIGTGDRAFGVECRVHPDGVQAHIDHHLGLGRAGWVLRDAFPTRWRDRLPELVVELAGADASA